MARVGLGIPSKRATIAINGLIRPDPQGGVDYTIRVDGHETSWTLPSGTPHAAAYSAAIDAMIQADAAGVTHLTLQTPANLVRRQAAGGWRKKSPELKRLGFICELYACNFDDVDWIKGEG